MLLANLEIYKKKLGAIYLRILAIKIPKNQDELTELYRLHKELEKVRKDLRLNKPPLGLIKGKKHDGNKE